MLLGSVRRSAKACVNGFTAIALNTFARLETFFYGVQFVWQV
jgi:hypothetical protein